MVWVGAIILFFNRWGKIRMLIPYQPDYKETQLKVPGTGVCSNSNTYQNQSGSALCCSQVSLNFFNKNRFANFSYSSRPPIIMAVMDFRAVAVFWIIVSNIMLARRPHLRLPRYILGIVTVDSRYYIERRFRINAISVRKKKFLHVEVDPKLTHAPFL